MYGNKYTLHNDGTRQRTIEPPRHVDALEEQRPQLLAENHQRTDDKARSPGWAEGPSLSGYVLSG